MKIQRLKDGRLRDAATGRVLKDAIRLKPTKNKQHAVAREKAKKHLKMAKSELDMAGDELASGVIREAISTLGY